MKEQTNTNETPKAKGKVYGIDLGTTNSVISIIEVKDPVVIPNANGDRTTPSVVSFGKEDSGDRKFGTLAKRQAVVNPKRTISSIKRFMGKNYTEVREIAEKMSYDIVPGDKDVCMVPIGDRRYPPQEISGMFLKRLVDDANEYLKQNIKDVVITVPAYFNDQERNATKDAGRIAGLNVLRIINEPTAAALAYGFKQKQQGDKKNVKLAIYDFGGGTFDISILECEDEVYEVKGTSGDAELGGDDIDEVLIKYITDEFRKAEGIDLTGDKMAAQRLREAAEKAKKELSFNNQVEINLPFITASAAGPKHLHMSLTRSKFEHLCHDLIERTLGPCQKACKAAGISPAEVDKILLVGGSTRIPMVQARVKKFFGKEPTQGINPDEVVALGAAVQGGILAGSVHDMVLLDVTSLSMGIETQGGIMHKLIHANTTIPTTKSEIFSTAMDGQTSVHVKIYQGERAMAKDNKLIGQMSLDDIEPAPRGVPQIEVSFDIDVNGILSVSAKDKKSGKSQHTRIESTSLSEEEIEKMKADAKAHEQEDKQAKQKVETLNKAESTLFQIEKIIKEDGKALEAEKRKELDTFIDKLKSAHTEKDAEKADDLMKAHAKFLAEVYQVLAAAKVKREAEKKEAPKNTDDANKTEAKDVDFEEVKEQHDSQGTQA